MVATTWVQIRKAVLLVTRVDRPRDHGVVTIRVFRGLPVQRRGRSEGAARVAQIVGDGAKNMTPAELGQRFLEPGLLSRRRRQISLGMASSRHGRFPHI